MEKVCRKCLLRDMNKEVYFNNLYTYIAQLDDNIKTPTKLYEQRLSTCQNCDLLLEGMCRACGCFVELRGAVINNRCPYDKW